MISLAWRRAVPVCALLIFFLIGCNPSTPIDYNRLIIDTYRPDPLLGLVFTETQITLFDDQANFIDEVSGGNATYPQFARLDYMGGITSGVYYIRIRVNPPTSFAGAYAIRVVTDINQVDEYPAAESWYFGVPFNTTDTPYENDDPLSGGIPTKKNSITIGDKHNRYLDAVGDDDWFQLVLP